MAQASFLVPRGGDHGSKFMVSQPRCQKPERLGARLGLGVPHLDEEWPMVRGNLRQMKHGVVGEEVGEGCVAEGSIKALHKGPPAPGVFVARVSHIQQTLVVNK